MLDLGFPDRNKTHSIPAREHLDNVPEFLIPFPFPPLLLSLLGILDRSHICIATLYYLCTPCYCSMEYIVHTGDGLCSAKGSRPQKITFYKADDRSHSRKDANNPALVDYHLELLPVGIGLSV